ncbi:isoleucyl-tRNA synthetase [Fulvimarina pelagi HTCC2506]|uniref:Isoleucine--tRNA ligase n=1 Tax=Fulvimarina pelagi HTCC2506 TaxID=314231 RepID=Q0G3R6_9HYPH|nr:isoleucine--tRNA ligase [Fulvimarina pelagi]EAU41765.1 isoleucyl-tRNA synthetase [Fulvimarina pelagi HTCC2506]
MSETKSPSAKTPETFDYSTTLFLPQTDFPMRAGLPKAEPEWIAKWDAMDLYGELRRAGRGRPKYVLHDGPPYANGNLHIGHALNKVLKDVITRAFQMRGYDSNYVPGWDCHGLPIEWKIEEQYRAKGLDKDQVPINEFRQECRDFATHWIGVQTEEFRRLGVEGDFATPYLTMNFDSEAVIAGELLKFAMSGQLYRGSKPVMWSVVEKTALAEAEVEYHDYESDTIWATFPVRMSQEAQMGAMMQALDVDGLSGGTESALLLKDAKVVIWTTTPWTIPGNRAITFSDRISYGVYAVTAPDDPESPRWAKHGERYLLADALAGEVFAKARVPQGGWQRVGDVAPADLEGLVCDHPLKGLAGGYAFPVPLLYGEHVTDDAGTGFVHTAPSHGREDFDAFIDAKRDLERRGIDPTIPFPVDDAGFYTKDAPGFDEASEGGAARVLDDKGKKGDANARVIAALTERGNLIARGRLKHTYPHSWRSKKPVIYRNTPQWFVEMDKDLGGYRLDTVGQTAGEDTLRNRALTAIDQTRFVPTSGQNRLRGMIADRPDWVLSRQRAWGVPICVFVNEDGEILKDDAVNERILQAFREEGADAWFADGARERFLGSKANENWAMVRDILDVWFDSGSTHAFCLEKRPDLKWPADLYLEGSDQHRGWFHSSLLESCGTRGRAPYNAVLTHGFVMDEEGRKMSKSLGNVVTPQEVIKQSGADILRLWVVSSDYSEDLRLGKTILQTNVDSYRKLRNTVRWMLGTLAHDRGETVSHDEMPELERLMLHRLAELDELVRKGYDGFDFKRISRALLDFVVTELSAFYFDVRKDSLYCDPPSATRRKASLQVVRMIFDRLVTWLAPMLPFTTEEAWLSRYPKAKSVHLEQFVATDPAWRDEALAARWKEIRKVRRVVMGALEEKRRDKVIGSSLEAWPTVHITDDQLRALADSVDFAEIAITSGLRIEAGDGPADAFRLPEIAGVAVVFEKAQGAKCARSWKITGDVGSDPEFPDVSVRDAEALRELKADGRLTTAA